MNEEKDRGSAAARPAGSGESSYSNQRCRLYAEADWCESVLTPGNGPEISLEDCRRTLTEVLNHVSAVASMVSSSQNGLSPDRCEQASSDSLAAVHKLAGQIRSLLKADIAEDTSQRRDMGRLKPILSQYLRALIDVIRHLPPSPAARPSLCIAVRVAPDIDTPQALTEGFLKVASLDGINCTKIMPGDLERADIAPAIFIDVTAWKYAQFWKNNVGMGDEGATVTANAVVTFVFWDEAGAQQTIQQAAPYDRTWRERRAAEAEEQYSKTFPQRMYSEDEFIGAWLRSILKHLPALPHYVRTSLKSAVVHCPGCNHGALAVHTSNTWDVPWCLKCGRDPITGRSAASVNRQENMSVWTWICSSASVAALCVQFFLGAEDVLRTLFFCVFGVSGIAAVALVIAGKAVRARDVRQLAFRDNVSANRLSCEQPGPKQHQ